MAAVLEPGIGHPVDRYLLPFQGKGALARRRMVGQAAVGLTNLTDLLLGQAGGLVETLGVAQLLPQRLGRTGKLPGPAAILARIGQKGGPTVLLKIRLAVPQKLYQRKRAIAALGRNSDPSKRACSCLSPKGTPSPMPISSA